MTLCYTAPTEKLSFFNLKVKMQTDEVNAVVGFSGGTRVISIIFMLKPRFTAFLYVIYPGLFN